MTSARIAVALLVSFLAVVGATAFGQATPTSSATTRPATQPAPDGATELLRNSSRANGSTTCSSTPR